MRTRHRRPLARPQARPQGRPRTRPALAAAAAAAVLALAGCGGGATDEPGAQATAATAAPPDAAAAVPAPEGAGATRTVTSMTSFRSPSGRIACFLAPVEGAPPFARCDQAEADWAEDVPAPESGCAGTWGGGADGRGIVGVGGGPAAVLCAGDDVVDPAAQELPYGESISLGVLTCTSRDTGMACDNTETGHGFTVSRSGVDLR